MASDKKYRKKNIKHLSQVLFQSTNNNESERWSFKKNFQDVFQDVLQDTLRDTSQNTCSNFVRIEGIKTLNYFHFRYLNILSVCLMPTYKIFFKNSGPHRTEKEILRFLAETKPLPVLNAKVEEARGQLTTKLSGGFVRKNISQSYFPYHGHFEVRLMGSPTAWLRIFSDKLRLSKIVVCSRYLLVKRFIPSFRSTVKDLLSRRAGYPKVLSLGNSELIFLNRKEGCQGGIKLHGLKVFFPDKPPVYRAKECSLRKIEFSIPEIWGRGRSPQGCGLPLRKFLTTTTIFRKNNSESASGENGLTNLFDFKAENFEIDNPDVKKEKYFEYQRNLSEEALSPKSLIKKHLSGKKVSGEQLQSGRELNIRSNLPKSSKNFITELRNSQKCIGESSQRELVPESQDAQGFVSSLQELCPKGRIVSFQVSFNVKSRRRVKSFRWSGFFFPFKKKKIPKILKSGNIFLNPRRKVFPIKGSIANMKDLLGVKKKTPKK